MSPFRGFRGVDDSASGRYPSFGHRSNWAVRGRCRRRHHPFFFGMSGYRHHGSAYGGYHGGFDGYPGYGGYQGYPGQGVDDYHNQPDGGYGGGYGHGGVQGYGGRNHGGGYGHGGVQGYGDQDHGYGGVQNYDQDQGYGGGYGGSGHGYGGYGGASHSQHDYSDHDHSQNMHQNSQFMDGRNGLYDSRQRHADESYLDQTGHDMTMTDGYGQRASEDDHSMDAGRRAADSQDVHIRRPDGSMVDSSQRDGSVDTTSEDNHSRTFSGPNNFATENEQDFSQNDSQFSDSNERSMD